MGEDRRRTLFMPPHELNDFLQSGAEAENSPNISKVEQLLSAAEETKLIYTNSMIFGIHYKENILYTKRIRNTLIFSA